MTASKNYELKVPTFENGIPEEFLHMMKDFNIATDGTGTTKTLPEKPTF